MEERAPLRTAPLVTTGRGAEGGVAGVGDKVKVDSCLTAGSARIGVTQTSVTRTLLALSQSALAVRTWAIPRTFAPTLLPSNLCVVYHDFRAE